MTFEQVITKQIHKEFNSKLYEVVNSGRKGTLIGAAIYEKPQQDFLKGDSDLLEKISDEWKSKGGDAQIYYKTKDSFKTGFLTINSIYCGMRFEICQKVEEEQVRKNLEEEVKKENPLKYVGIFLSIEIR